MHEHLTLRHRAVSVLQRFQLGRALRALERSAPAPRVDAHVLAALIRAWRNEGWSASAAYLQSIRAFLAETSGAILECGSGLSTLVVGALVRDEARPVLALEHHVLWAQRVNAALAAHALTHVNVALTKLRSYGAFDWYDLDSVRVPDDIGFVICDGPPASTRGGRVGALYALAPRLRQDCIVLLDDTQRPEEQAIMERWRRDFRVRTVLDGGSFTALQVAAAGDAGASRAT